MTEIRLKRRRVPFFDILPISDLNVNTKEEEPAPYILPSKPKETIELIKYNDISHLKGFISFHIWTDIEVIAATIEPYPISKETQYFILATKFPFTSNGQYFATASSFIDHGFSTMEYIEKASILRKLNLLRKDI